MNLEKFISSLYIYYNKLFVGYTSGKILIYDFPIKNGRTYNFGRVSYQREISAASAIVEMQSLQHVLFVSTSDKLYGFDFLRMNDSVLFDTFEKEIPDCSNIKIDSQKKLLFAFSTSLGIFLLDIKNPHKPKFIKNIKPEILKSTGSLDVTDLDVYENTIFMSIRNSQIMRIDLDLTETNEKINHEFTKMVLSDPQDVKYSPKSNLLYIADADQGFYVYDIQSGTNLFSKSIETNSGFPQKIILDGNNAIVKLSSSVYYYNHSKKSFDLILDSKIGCIAKYFKMYVYTKQNTFNIFKIGSFTNQEFNSLSSSEIKFQNINSFSTKNGKFE